MKPADITKTVVEYFVGNYQRFPGVMYSNGDTPNHVFLVNGRVTSRNGDRTHQRITYGTAIDVLADTIEREQFFGDLVSESPEQATNSHNAEIIWAGIQGNEAKIKICGTFGTIATRVGSPTQGLTLVAEKVAPKRYLEPLKTKEGFINAANALKTKENLEEIAKNLYEI